MRQPSLAPSLYRRPGGLRPMPPRAGGWGGLAPKPAALGLGFLASPPLGLLALARMGLGGQVVRLAYEATAPPLPPMWTPNTCGLHF